MARVGPRYCSGTVSEPRPDPVMLAQPIAPRCLCSLEVLGVLYNQTSDLVNLHLAVEVVTVNACTLPGGVTPRQAAVEIIPTARSGSCYFATPPTRCRGQSLHEARQRDTL